MKITLGYYDKKGKRLRAKRPKPGTNFYLVMGTLRKKIAELKDTTPYRVPVTETNAKFCDKKRLMIEILYFVRGRFDAKIPPYACGRHYSTAFNIRENVNNRKSEMAKQYKIRMDNFHWA